MAHQECHQIGSWVDQNISQPLEQCEEQDCNWWCLCCNKWFCFILWVIVTLVTWVIQTVCEIIADVVDLVVNIVKGVIDVLVGLFTGDWTRLAAGLGEIVGGVVAFVAELIPIVTLGTLYGAFETSRNAFRLRDYVNGQLTDRFGKDDPDGLAKMQDALGINSGGFGLRLQCTAHRLFIRSDFTRAGADKPLLLEWADQPGNDIKMLAGFKKLDWWNRQWPVLIGDGDASIDESDIDTYIAMGGRGESVKHFTIFSMDTGDMQKRLDTAVQHATEIGLILQWSVDDQEAQFVNQISINTSDDSFKVVLTEAPFNRTNKSTNLDAARMELCSPMTFAAFECVGKSNNGISSLFGVADCIDPSSGPLGREGVTGTCFRFRQPDLFYKYVTIHELGHTFGLCHVDGLLRIMFTNGKTVWSNASAKQYWTSGLEAGFDFEEAKKVWNYILLNFSPDCLKARQF